MKIEKVSLFGEPIVDIIRKRRSVRAYSKQPIPADVIEKVQRYFRELHGPFPVDIRFEWLDKLKIKADTQLKLGTYGVIQGATSFVAAAVPKKERNMEQLGYVFEHLILYLTSIGLGTCWMAGTYNKSQFAKAMGIGRDEIFPAVTPVGYDAGFNPIGALIRRMVKAAQRKPWSELFFQQDFGALLAESDAGVYAEPLEMLRLAPSASNKQPWRVVRDNGFFHFYLAHDPNYQRHFPYDIQKIDLGIAMCHFELTAKEAGLQGSWETRTPVVGDVPGGMEYIITWVSE